MASKVKFLDGAPFILECSDANKFDKWTEKHKVDLDDEKMKKKYAIEIEAA